MSNPKLFISYSWTNTEHQAWVLRLATDLMHSGVDVILDKWDLKEGNDAHVFMERMVSDPSIKKVALICDSHYVAKADGRDGGVGTETQIISPEVYSAQDQNKFVAIVRELDADGRALVPAYCRSRIHIDFSDEGGFADAFEQLLRWIYDKPLHEKPSLGRAPSFLIDGADSISLGTAARCRRALDAVINSRPHLAHAVDDYFATLASGLEKFRIAPTTDPFDDQVVRSIEDFLPYRNEAIEVFLALSAYRPEPESSKIVHRFLERVLPYFEHLPGASSWTDTEFDNFTFVGSELFLYAIASLLKHERFSAVAYLLNADYFLPNRATDGRDAVATCTEFCVHLRSLEQRNARLKLHRQSLHADLLHDRCAGLDLQFRHVMQADLVIWLHTHFRGAYWIPYTLAYAGRFPGVVEVFARCRSQSYFQTIAEVIGISGTDELVKLAETALTRESPLPKWGYSRINLGALLGVDYLASKP